MITKKVLLMKRFVLMMTMAAVAASQGVFAQNRVKNLYTEAQTLKVEQVMNTEQTVQVNRYLFAGYNTLCLPMSMSAEQLAGAAQGLKVERMAAIRQEGSTLCLYFVDCTAEGIEAGVPYLVFSPVKQYLRAKNTEADKVDEELVTIRMNDSQGNQVSFASSWELRNKDGLYGIPAKQNVEILESVLVRTTADLSILPTRCGFNWESQSPAADKLEICHASGAEITGIRDALRLNNNEEIKNNNTYDLNGQRVNASAKGVVIQNGKKIVKH